MVQENTYTLVHQHSKETVFSIYSFEELAHLSQLQRLNYYSLVWVQEGAGKVTADFNTLDYKDNYLFAFAPFQPFLFQEELPSKGYVIHFHPDFFCIHKHQQEVACNGLLFNNIYDLPYIQIDEATSTFMTMLVQEIQKDIAANEMAMDESVLSYLKLFLIQAVRLRKKQQPKQVLDNECNLKQIPQQLKNMIDTKFRELHTPKEYANSLHISPKSLAKIAKKYFNKTLTALIAERIIIEAKRELFLTSKSVREIAYDLGYEDEFYFSRFFKKNTLVSPSQFRQNLSFVKETVKV